MDTSRYFWEAPDTASRTDTDPKDDRVRLEPVRMGFVGIGLMGGASLKRFLSLPATVVALCDVDSERLDQAASVVAEHSPASSPRLYADFRDLCRDSEVEAVVISTPDHWHVEIAVVAMEHGKDVYVEKPLSLTIAGGRRLADTASATKRVVQTGSQQRSSKEFRRAVELVRNGALGTLTSIEVTLPPNNVEPPELEAPTSPPESFDHRFWLGPAPWREYHPELCHYNFRFISDYSGGQMTNWGAHHLDVVQWALAMDASGPVEVEGTGVFHPSGPFDTATSVDILYRYGNGLPVHCVTSESRTGVEFHGEQGTLSVGRGYLEAEPVSILDQKDRPGDVQLTQSKDHYLSFLEAVRTRGETVAPAETGHRSATVCHLGNIALKLGRSLRWDPETEAFLGDEEANDMRSRPRRNWEGATQS